MRGWTAVAIALLLCGCPKKGTQKTRTLPPTALWPSRPPRLPPDCARKGRLVFVGMDRLVGTSVDEVARHFSETYGLAVEVLPSYPPTVFDAAWEPNQQLNVDKAIAGLAAHLGTLADVWVMALTHFDLKIDKRTELGFAFSGRHGPITLLSIARMTDTNDLQVDVRLLQSRLFKQMARQIGTTYCGLARKGPPTSVMRETIQVAADLDSIDEADWRSGPQP